MKQETIIGICVAEGLIDYELFVEFFSKRFPDESDSIHSYCREWVHRFQKGNPMVYMDNISKKVYLDVINNWGH